MNIKQLKWILNKALFLICAYEGRILTEEDCEKITRYAQEAYQASKRNGYCKNIMLDVICALNREDYERNREKFGNGDDRS